MKTDSKRLFSLKSKRSEPLILTFKLRTFKWSAFASTSGARAGNGLKGKARQVEAFSATERKSKNNYCHYICVGASGPDTRFLSSEKVGRHWSVQDSFPFAFKPQICCAGRANQVNQELWDEYCIFLCCVLLLDILLAPCLLFCFQFWLLTFRRLISWGPEQCFSCEWNTNDQKRRWVWIEITTKSDNFSDY